MRGLSHGTSPKGDLPGLTPRTRSQICKCDLQFLQPSPVGWGIAASREAAEPKRTRVEARIEVSNFIRHLIYFQAPVIAKRPIHNMPRSAPR